MSTAWDWNASVYDALPLPHLEWSDAVLERLSLRGDEHVLDAGAGTGRDVERLLERLPKGHVTALDRSPTMLERLRERLAGRMERVTVVEGDLTRPLPVGTCDAAMSVAVLHWIADHDTVFANLAQVLRPGAAVSIDCGGRGNIAAVLAAVDRVGDPLDEHPWNFAGVEQTTAALERAGFVPVSVELVPGLTRLRPGDEHEAYLATVVLGAHLAALPPDGVRDWVHAVATELGEPIVDYVRLRIVARRGR